MIGTIAFCDVAGFAAISRLQKCDDGSVWVKLMGGVIAEPVARSTLGVMCVSPSRRVVVVVGN